MAFVECALVEGDVCKNDQEREKMLVLLGYFLYLKVDQTKKNICHHNRRMFSIKGILV